MSIVEKIVHWQELDSCNSQAAQVTDGGFRGESGVSAAQPLWYLVMQLGKAFHVQLIDQRLVPRYTWWAVVTPGKGCIDDHRQGGVWCAVALVEGQIGLGVSDAIAEELVGPAHVTADGLGIGIEHHLVRVKPVALLGLIWAIHAIAIELAR